MTAGVVSIEYRGTAADQVYMQDLGRTQDTRRLFHFWTISAFGTTLIVTVEVILFSFQLNLANGGTAGMFWGYLYVVVGFALVYSRLAGLASMFPTAGGQYDWVSFLAPEKCQRYLSFTTGWLTWLGWQSGITAIAFLIAGAIQGLIALTHPDYDWPRWHSTLLTIAIVLAAVVINIFAPRRIPQIEGGLAILRLIGILAIIMVLWILGPKNNPHSAFLQFTNTSGWATAGLAFLTGNVVLQITLLGFDSMVHMAEETKDAIRSMPRSIMHAFVFNAFLGLLGIITLIFTCGDLNGASDSPYGSPVISVFYNVTGSITATIVMIVLIIISLFGSEIACIATASRQVRALARDRGVPCSTFVGRIHLKSAVPVNAIVVSFCGCILLSLINLGSTTALNAIIALNVGCLLGSYILSIGCDLLGRIRGEKLPQRIWSFGVWGTRIDVVALCWLSLAFVFAMFPSVLPVDPASMNWGSLIFGSIVLFSAGYYLVKGKQEYISPKERRQNAESGIELSRRRPGV